MKKNVIFGLFVILLVFGFTGCDDGNENNEFTVTFNLDGGNINGNINSINITVKSGETVTNFPIDPVKVNNDTFGGWYMEKNGLGNEFTLTTKVTSNITVYADWLFFGPKKILVSGLNNYNGKYGRIQLRIENDQSPFASSLFDMDDGSQFLIINGEFFVYLIDWEDEDNDYKWCGDGYFCTRILIYPEQDITSGAILRLNSEEKINFRQKEITNIKIEDYIWQDNTN